MAAAELAHRLGRLGHRGARPGQAAARPVDHLDPGRDGRARGDEPDEPRRLHLDVYDEDHWSYHLQARFEDGKQLTSIALWRPEGDNAAVVAFEGMDLFGLPAREILDRLRENGDEVDENDGFYPTARRITLGFDREDGDERDEQDLAVYFASVLIAPPGYYESSDS